MKQILSLLFLPLWCIGWLIGFIAKPFIMGFTEGFIALYIKELNETRRLD